MKATAEEPVAVKTEVKVDETKVDLKLVETKLPKIRGTDRRIHFLWGKYYRVNYHDQDNNYIKHSYFVKIISPDHVEVQWTESLGNQWLQKIEIR
jgi:hypothetical protein